MKTHDGEDSDDLTTYGKKRISQFLEGEHNKGENDTQEETQKRMGSLDDFEVGDWQCVDIGESALSPISRVAKTS